MELSNVNQVPIAAPAFSGGERVAYEGEAQASAPVQSSGGGASASAAATKKEPSDAELAKLMEEPIKQANKALAGYDRQIEREVHEVTKTMMFKIRDTKSGDVIAEYPPKKIQDMIAKMWELAGLFIDQKA